MSTIKQGGVSSVMTALIVGGEGKELTRTLVAA
jgi:hypothetical protein